jgi:hypothetical protein
VKRGKTKFIAYAKNQYKSKDDNKGIQHGVLDE